MKVSTWNALSKKTSGISKLMYGKIRIIERSDNMKKVVRNGLEKSRIQEFAFIIIEIFSLLRSFKKLIPPCFDGLKLFSLRISKTFRVYHFFFNYKFNN